MASVAFAFGVRLKQNQLRPMSRNLLLPMLSSRCFMVSGHKSKSLMHLEFIFVCGVKIVVQFHSFACSSPIFPTPSIEESVLSPLYILGSCVVN